MHGWLFKLKFLQGGEDKKFLFFQLPSLSASHLLKGCDNTYQIEYW